MYGAIARFEAKAHTNTDDVFQRWYALLAAKGDFEAQASRSIKYVKLSHTEDAVLLFTRHSVPDRLIGRSCFVRGQGGRLISCEILDANRNMLSIKVTSGDREPLPPDGCLEMNVIAVRRSLERQHAALDAVNFDRAANPRLRNLFIDPSCAQPPQPVPVKAYFFNDDFRYALSNAIGVQDVFLVKAPPGTGRVALVKEIVDQYMRHTPKHRILLSSHSQIAVDFLIDRIQIQRPDIDIVRLSRRGDPRITDDFKTIMLK